MATRKPSLGLIIAPCIISSFMFTCGLMDYVIITSNNQKLIDSYFNAKPFFIIGVMQTYIIPAMVLLKVIKCSVDIIQVFKRKATTSNWMAILFLFTLALITTQFIPLKQVEGKLINGNASKTDIDNAAKLTLRILFGNVGMLTQGIMTYFVNLKEYNDNNDNNAKTKKDTKKDK